MVPADMPEFPHTTLVIRFSSVGDIVLSSLLLRVLHRRFPQSRIDYLVKEEFADLIRYHPNVARVISFPAGGTFRDLRRLRDHVRASGYDLIVDIHDSLRSRYLAFGRHPTVRIRKRKFARWMLVNTKLDLYGSSGGAPGVALRYLETIRQFGAEDDGQGLEVFVPDAITASMRDFLEREGIGPTDRLIGMAPSAKHGNKMWPAERFAEVACTLAQRPGASVILFGAKEERLRCGEIETLIRASHGDAKVINAAGKLSLLETAAAMDRCSLVVSNDSGLMHLAAARKRKIVAVFGPTVRQLGFFPFGTESVVVEHKDLGCRPCTHIGLPSCPKGHFRCMKEIPAARVLEAAHHLLES